jgi:hypothetical protein
MGRDGFIRSSLYQRVMASTVAQGFPLCLVQEVTEADFFTRCHSLGNGHGELAVATAIWTPLAASFPTSLAFVLRTVGAMIATCHGSIGILQGKNKGRRSGCSVDHDTGNSLSSSNRYLFARSSIEHLRTRYKAVERIQDAYNQPLYA